MRQFSGLRVSEDRYAVLVHRSSGGLGGIFISLSRVFKSLPGQFLSGLMILLTVRLRGTPVCVGSRIVQLGGPLVIFVVRSVVVTCRHLRPAFLGT